MNKDTARDTGPVEPHMTDDEFIRDRSPDDAVADAESFADRDLLDDAAPKSDAADSMTPVKPPFGDDAEHPPKHDRGSSRPNATNV